jgi:transcriptional regulator with PAS, ATPase and Fis domain
LLLAYYFLDLFQERMKKNLRGISPDALKILAAYAYPGNVRELMNIMERAVALCRGDLILARDLPPELSDLQLDRLAKPGKTSPNLEELERNYIKHILDLAGGVRTKAADLLGISRVSLWRKMKKYGID